jgi:hypothetical protein
MLLDTILSALLPMVVTFLLGFVAAWRHDFGSKDAPTLNRMVLLYAVSIVPSCFPHATQQLRSGRADGFRASSTFRRSSRSR